MKKTSPKHKVKNPCPHCKGTGEHKQKNGPAHICHECNGSGEKKLFEMMFWHYSTFPYVIASPGFLEDNGTAYIPSFCGHFRPFLILGLKEGNQLKLKLETLETEHKAAHQTLDEGFKARLKTICPKALK